MYEKDLWNARFRVILSGLGDIWAVHGYCDGKDIVTSRPVKFDPDTRIMTTHSGSQYYIASTEEGDEKFFEQLKDALGQ